MESVLVKRTGTSFGPPGKAKLIYFIDDLNLPEVDPYNTQSGIALLRQVIEYVSGVSLVVSRGTRRANYTSIHPIASHAVCVCVLCIGLCGVCVMCNKQCKRKQMN
jgi:hypothetical protein